MLAKLSSCLSEVLLGIELRKDSNVLSNSIFFEVTFVYLDLSQSICFLDLET